MKSHGFTLIEILIYVGIVAMLLLSLSVFLRVVLEARIKNQVIAEVEGQGISVMQVITQTLRNASIVNTPAVGASATSLSVDTPAIDRNPTIFYLLDGSLFIKEGLGVDEKLTSDQVLITNLNFSNLSAVNTKGSIQVQFDVSNNSSSTNFEYRFTKTFMGSATIR